VLLDLTDVAFIDAAGVRALLLGHRRACACRAVLRLVGPRGLVLRVLELTGALDVLTTEPPDEPVRPRSEDNISHATVAASAGLGVCSPDPPCWSGRPSGI